MNNDIDFRSYVAIIENITIIIILNSME